MTPEEIQEIKELEEELKKIGDSDSYGSPSPEKKDSVFKFFREIIHLPETWKVGNLHDTEIGKSRLGVRSYLELGQYAKAENLDIVGNYFVDRAAIVGATSMGRKGFLAQLFVTQIKKEQKVKEPSSEKKKWFARQKEESENE